MSDDIFRQMIEGFKKGWSSPIRQSVQVRSRPSFWSLKSWRQQEQDDIAGLRQKVYSLYEGSIFTDNDFLNEAAFEITNTVRGRLAHPLSDELLEAIYQAVFDIIDQEFFLYFSDPTKNWQQQLDLKQAHEISQFLKRHLRFIENADDYSIEACEKLSLLFEGIVKEISMVPATEDTISFLRLDTPLMNFMDDPALIIERTIATLFDKDISDKQLFEETRQQLIHNLSLASGQDPNNQNNLNSGKFIIPPEQKQKSTEQLLELYLAHTPFTAFFNMSLPIPIREEVRFEHMHLLAGTGHGKTQALQHLIANDLQRPPDEIPAMVILDS